MQGDHEITTFSTNETENHMLGTQSSDSYFCRKMVVFLVFAIYVFKSNFPSLLLGNKKRYF